MKKLAIFIIVFIFIFGCSLNEVNPPDDISIINNSSIVDVYETNDGIYVKGITPDIVTEINYLVNNNSFKFNDSIVLDEVKLLYDISGFIYDRFYDEVIIEIISVDTY